jgi:hypothetical protein
VREGPFHRPQFSTSIVDVGRGQLLDVVPGRRASERGSGSQRRAPRGSPGSPTRPLISPARIGRSSMRWCPTPPRSQIRSMW